MVRTSDSQFSENPGLNPLAAVSKLWLFHSLHVATVYQQSK